MAHHPSASGASLSELAAFNNPNNRKKPSGLPAQQQQQQQQINPIAALQQQSSPTGSTTNNNNAVRFNESVSVANADGSQAGPATLDGSPKQRSGIAGMGAAARLALGLKRAGKAAAKRVAAKKSMIANSSILSPSPSRGEFEPLSSSRLLPSTTSFASNSHNNSRYQLPIDELNIERSVSETDSLADGLLVSQQQQRQQPRSESEKIIMQEKLIQPPHLMMTLQKRTSNSSSKKQSPARDKSLSRGNSVHQASLGESNNNTNKDFLSWASSDSPSSQRKSSPVKIASEMQARKEIAELRAREREIMQKYGLAPAPSSATRGGGGAATGSSFNQSMRLPLAAGGNLNASIGIGSRKIGGSRPSPGSRPLSRSNSPSTMKLLPGASSSPSKMNLLNLSQQTNNSGTSSRKNKLPGGGGGSADNNSNPVSSQSPGSAAIPPLGDFANFSFQGNTSHESDALRPNSLSNSMRKEKGGGGGSETPPLAPKPASSSNNNNNVIKEPSPSIRMPDPTSTQAKKPSNSTAAAKSESVAIEIDPEVYNAMTPEQQWAYYYSVVGKQQEQQQQSSSLSQSQQQEASKSQTHHQKSEPNNNNNNNNSNLLLSPATGAVTKESSINDDEPPPMTKEMTMVKYASFSGGSSSKAKIADDDAKESTTTPAPAPAVVETKNDESDDENRKQRVINYYLEYAAGNIPAENLSEQEIADLHLGAKYYEEQQKMQQQQQQAKEEENLTREQDNNNNVTTPTAGIAQQQQQTNNKEDDDRNKKKEQEADNNNNNNSSIEELAKQYPREDLISFYMQYAQGQIDTSALTQEQVQLLHIGARYYQEQVELQEKEEEREHRRALRRAQRKLSSVSGSGSRNEDDEEHDEEDEFFHEDDDDEFGDGRNGLALELPELHEAGVQTDPVKIISNSNDMSKARDFLLKKKASELRKLADSGNVVHLGELAGHKVAPIDAPAVVDSLLTADEKKRLLSSKGAQSILFHDALKPTASNLASVNRNSNNNNNKSSGNLVGTLLDEQQQLLFGESRLKNRADKKDDSRHKAIPGVGEATAKDKIDSWFGSVSGETLKRGQTLKVQQHVDPTTLKSAPSFSRRSSSFHLNDGRSGSNNNNARSGSNNNNIRLRRKDSQVHLNVDNNDQTTGNINNGTSTLSRNNSFGGQSSVSNLSAAESDSGVQNLVPNEIGKFKKSAVDESSVSWRAVASQIAAARKMRERQQQQQQQGHH